MHTCACTCLLAIVGAELQPVCDLWFSDLEPFFPLQTTRRTCWCAGHGGYSWEGVDVCLGRGDLCLVPGESDCQLLRPLTSSKSETWVLMSKEQRN